MLGRHMRRKGKTRRTVKRVLARAFDILDHEVAAYCDPLGLKRTCTLLELRLESPVARAQVDTTTTVQLFSLELGIINYFT